MFLLCLARIHNRHLSQFSSPIALRSCCVFFLQTLSRLDLFCLQMSSIFALYSLLLLLYPYLFLGIFCPPCSILHLVSWHPVFDIPSILGHIRYCEFLPLSIKFFPLRIFSFFFACHLYLFLLFFLLYFYLWPSVFVLQCHPYLLEITCIPK